MTSGDERVPDDIGNRRKRDSGECMTPFIDEVHPLVKACGDRTEYYDEIKENVFVLH